MLNHHLVVPGQALALCLPQPQETSQTRPWLPCAASRPCLLAWQPSGACRAHMVILVHQWLQLGHGGTPHSPTCQSNMLPSLPVLLGDHLCPALPHLSLLKLQGSLKDILTACVSSWRGVRPLGLTLASSSLSSLQLQSPLSLTLIPHIRTLSSQHLWAPKGQVKSRCPKTYHPMNK